MHLSRRHLSIVAVLTLILIPLWGCSSTSKRLSDSDRALLHLKMAQANLMEGDPTGALQQAVVAENLDSKNPQVYLLKGMALHTKKEFTQAIQNIEIAIKLSPDLTEAQNIYGKMLLDAGRYSEAEAPLQKAAFNPLYRESFKAKTSLGILYYRQGKDTRAVELFENAVSDSPTQACIAHYYLGHINLKAKKYPQAVENYKNASNRTCSNFSDAHFALGLSYEKIKNYNQARLKYVDVTRGFPDTPAAKQANDRLRYLP